MPSVGLAVEVAGCPTICMHCWAQGARYGSMPVEDARWLLTELEAFRSSRTDVEVRP
jgi:hypothetical protein